MTVPEVDRQLLLGAFEETEGIPTDKLWLLRHFDDESEGFMFAIYYLKMKSLLTERGRWLFVRGYQEHSGYICVTNHLTRWLNRILRVEKAVEKAAVEQNFKKLAALKLGKKNKLI